MRAVVFTGAGRERGRPGSRTGPTRLQSVRTSSCRCGTRHSTAPISPSAPAGIRLRRAAGRCPRDRDLRNGDRARRKCAAVRDRRPRLRDRRRRRSRRSGARAPAPRRGSAAESGRHRGCSRARGLHHGARRGLHARPAQARRAAGGDRCQRRRRHGGSPDRSGRRGSSARDRARPRPSSSASPPWARR